MAEHKIVYRNELDPKNGCIHSMAKFARCLIWKKLCPKARLRMKEAIFDEDGKKIRRRNVFNNYDPVINIVDDPINDESIRRNTQSIEPFLDKNKTSSEPGKDQNISSSDSLDEYKNKIRAYAKHYLQMNGKWFDINDIESVSDC